MIRYSFYLVYWLKSASHLIGKSYGIEEVVGKCRLEIQNYVDSGVMPSPNYFLLAANYFRKKRNYANEASICELYVELIQEYSELNRPLEERLTVKLQNITSQFEARLYKINYKHLENYRLHFK